MNSAERTRDAAAKAVDRAEAALAKARSEFDATPLRNLKQKAEGKAAVVKAQADLAARKAALLAKEAEYAAKRAVYDALSSDAVDAARRAVKETEAAARAAAQHLREMESLVNSIRAGRGTPIVIDRASFHGRLDSMAGGTLDLALDLHFLGQPRRVTVPCDFHRLEDGADRLAQALIGKK